MKEAEFYKHINGITTCELCPNLCQIANGKTGSCLTRTAQEDKLYATTYSSIVSLSLDPIEKKPLYHFFPGSFILSTGSYGCNLHCKFCQNYEISQQKLTTQNLISSGLLKEALKYKENIGVAFTYNEPGIWYEYIKECAPLLKANGLAVVLVTNGYLSNQPWANLCKYTDAMNIDLKGFTEDFYKNVCHASLETVKNNIITAYNLGVHLELTNLLIPTLNDDPATFDQMTDWIASISDSIPLHISRYFPRYKLAIEPTPESLIDSFVKVAQKKLKYVYKGNLGSEENTSCSKCGRLLIQRNRYQTKLINASTKCLCGEATPFVKAINLG